MIGDDIGFPHYGFMGHPRIETPAMDALVEWGVLFPVAYNSGGMCIPSLETILTGRYQKDFHASRKSGYGDLYLTAPIALRKAGYVSYQAGKFWSGQKATGFDQWLDNGRDKIGRDTMQPIFDFVDERLRNDRKPFFVWYAPRLPHRPLSSPRYTSTSSGPSRIRMSRPTRPRISTGTSPGWTTPSPRSSMASPSAGCARTRCCSMWRTTGGCCRTPSTT